MVNVILNFANHFHQCYSSSMFLGLDNQFFFSCMFSAVTREICNGVCVISSVNPFQFLPGISFKAHQNVDCSSKSERLVLRLQTRSPQRQVFFSRGKFQSTLLLVDCESREAAGACWCTAPIQQQKHKICRPLFLSFLSECAPAILQHVIFLFCLEQQCLLYFATTKSSQILPSHIKLPLSFRK